MTIQVGDRVTFCNDDGTTLEGHSDVYVVERWLGVGEHLAIVESNTWKGGAKPKHITLAKDEEKEGEE